MPGRNFPILETFIRFGHSIRKLMYCKSIFFCNQNRALQSTVFGGRNWWDIWGRKSVCRWRRKLCSSAQEHFQKSNDWKLEEEKKTVTDKERWMSKFSAAHCTSPLCEAVARAPGKKYAKDLHYQPISCWQLSERVQYSLARFFSSFRFQSGSWKNSWRVMWSARKKSSGERWSSRWLRSTSSGNLRFVTRSCCIYREEEHY